MDAANNIDDVDEPAGGKPEQEAEATETLDRDGDDSSGYRTALILSAIAYCTDIEKQLKIHAPDWKPVWLPKAEYEGNFAYVASDGNQYVVAIRGSVLSFSWEAFQNWFKQDLNIFTQVRWQYPASNTNPQISKGASDGLSHLQKLVSADGVYLLDFLMKNAVGNNEPITVTGHSLGGALATVFAPWLNYQMKTAGKTLSPLRVLTYAAPAIGNPAFVRAYDSLFAGKSRMILQFDRHRADVRGIHRRHRFVV